LHHEHLQGNFGRHRPKQHDAIKVLWTLEPDHGADSISLEDAYMPGVKCTFNYLLHVTTPDGTEVVIDPGVINR
jgi:hypothetical protein